MRAIRENKIRFALTAALFYFLAASASILLLIILTVWAAAFLLYLFFSSNRAQFSYRLLLIFGLTSLLFIFPLIYPQLKQMLSQGQSDFIITANSSLPSDIATFVTPPWLWREPRGVYLGLPILALLLTTRPKVGWWWTVFIISCLIVIGPQPELADRPLNITLPWSLPIVSLLRHAHRLNILVSFSLSVLAAYSWLELDRCLRQRSWSPQLSTLLGLLFVLLVYVDYTTYPYPKIAPNVSTFYTDYLKDVPDEIALATIPFGRQEDKRYLFYQTIHNHPITGGVVSRPVADTVAFIEQTPLLRAGIKSNSAVSLPPNLEQELASLTQYQIGYLIIHKNLLLPEQVETWRAALSRMPVFEDAQLIAYTLNSTD
jgi:hypothetical protein